MAMAKKTAAKKTATKKAATAKKSTAKRTPAKKTATAKRTPAPATKTEADVLADVTAKQAAMADASPEVLSGTVVTEHLDPDAERALKDPDVATDYRAAKARLQELTEIEGRRTEILEAVARSLVDLRAHFKEPGSRGRRIDWNGKSREYQALAELVYRDAGVEGPGADSTKRSIRYHVETRKREVVPAKEWEHYGIQALTRGQRQSLVEKSARAQAEMEETAEKTATAAASGAATGQQLVSLMKRIDAGLSVYSMASLQALTPNQRKTFRQELEETKTKTDQLMEELDNLD